MTQIPEIQASPDKLASYFRGQDFMTWLNSLPIEELSIAQGAFETAARRSFSALQMRCTAGRNTSLMDERSAA